MTRRALILFALLWSLGCQSSPEADRSVESSQEPAPSEATQPPDEEEPITDRSEERSQMVTTTIEQRGVEDEAVLEAMRTVQRHLYIPAPLRDRAYQDSPLPIGHNQTISQPYIVALMTELLQVSPEHRVLEIGTGSGYQAAVLAEMGATVFSIEIICELAERAVHDLNATGYENVTVRCGDGYKGWPDEAPFDRIIITAAPPELPQALVDQLADGGRLVVPVGEDEQMLQVVEKDADGNVEISDKLPVRFVPMVHGPE